MSNEIQYKMMDITPKWAGDVMDKHWERIAKNKFKQRPISPATISRYAMEMKNGQWKYSPQSIDFDEDGNLINGQHRLEAVRRSGVTVPMTVTTGWPVGQTIKVIDQGKGRSVGALLQLEGYGSATNLAATVANACRVAFRGQSSGVTFAQTEYLLTKMGLMNSIEAIMSKSSSTRDYIGRLIGPLAYYHTSKPNKALQFANGVFNLEGERGSPINLYLNWVKNRGHLRGGSSDYHMMGLCACLRAWDNNDTITMVRLHREAIEWLANTNPKLRDWIKEHVAKSSGKKVK